MFKLLLSFFLLTACVTLQSAETPSLDGLIDERITLNVEYRDKYVREAGEMQLAASIQPVEKRTGDEWIEFLKYVKKSEDKKLKTYVLRLEILAELSGSYYNIEYAETEDDRQKGVADVKKWKSKLKLLDDSTKDILPVAGMAVVQDNEFDATMLKMTQRKNGKVVIACLMGHVFSGQITFQGASFSDADGDDWGRYGFIDELNGGRAVMNAKKGEIDILTKIFPVGQIQPEYSGYYFKVYLPKGVDGAYASADEMNAKNEDNAERHYIMYAWPKSLSDGIYKFAVMEDGRIRYSRMSDEDFMKPNGPDWNEVWGAKEKWTTNTAWEMLESYKLADQLFE
ncbi:MAG: hypothetical protein HRU15_20450 [Planctomycetes bacterium]|nr:hypothetical protein [Planctomycetota bacterium]